MSELVKIIVSFVLTFVLGGYIGVIYQSKLWNEQEAARESARIKSVRNTEAVILYKDVSTAMSKAHYRLRTYIRYYRNGWDGELVKSQWTQYELARDEFASNYDRNRVLLGCYFNKSILVAFDQFCDDAGKAELAYLSDPKDYATVDTLLDKAKIDIGKFNGNAVMQLQFNKMY